MSTVRLALISLLAALMAACQSAPTVKLYNGPDRPAAELTRISVPDTLEVLSINGQKLERSSLLFGAGRQELQLVPGDYEILVAYKEYWDTTTESHTVLRSDPVRIRLHGRAGERYELSHPAPRNLTEAQDLADDFQAWAVNQGTGQRIAAEQSGLRRTTLLDRLQGERSATVAETPAPVTAIAPLNVAAGAATTDPAPTAATSTAAASTEGDYLVRLKALWNQATTDERRAFLQWVSE